MKSSINQQHIDAVRRYKKEVTKIKFCAKDFVEIGYTHPQANKICRTLEKFGDAEFVGYVQKGKGPATKMYRWL